MSWLDVWFSLRGRINRQVYWHVFAIPLIIAEVITLIIDLVAIAADLYSLPVFVIVLALASVWPGLATIVKRLHDRNRSGWFAFFLLVPFANIWILIEVYFLKGTDGFNNYGPDPLG